MEKKAKETPTKENKAKETQAGVNERKRNSRGNNRKQRPENKKLCKKCGGEVAEEKQRCKKGEGAKR